MQRRLAKVSAFYDAEMVLQKSIKAIKEQTIKELNNIYAAAGIVPGTVVEIVYNDEVETGIWEGFVDAGWTPFVPVIKKIKKNGEESKLNVDHISPLSIIRKVETKIQL